MITRNFENLLASLLEAPNANTFYGGLPVINVNGVTRFLSGSWRAFPYSVTGSAALDKTSAGISIGTGGSAESALDINLEQTITSGVTVSITAAHGCEAPGTLYKDYTLTVTNNGAEAIAIREIGYKQSLYIEAVPGPASAASDFSEVFLLDRTVLNPAVVIQAGDAGVIKYRLATGPRKRIINDVTIVSFTGGSDAQIAEMIDAAREGLIDLQADAGWRVGDARTIQLAAWTGGGNTAHAAQQREIVISQFGDYNGCGCLFQFDFMNELDEKQRMNATNTTVGGYGASEMYLTTLPAMVEALPEWLRTRLKSFDVLANAGDGASEIETVPNNKLALRADSEVTGGTSYSAAGEGSQVDRYKYSATRNKRTARAGTGTATEWWLRSSVVQSGYRSYFCQCMGSNGVNYQSPSYGSGLSPFGCI